MLEFARETFKLEPVDLLMIPIGAVLFFALWTALKKYLFDPCVRLVEEREALTEGARETAAAERERAVQLNADYEGQLTEARIAAMRKKLELLADARDEAAQIVQRAEEQESENLQRERERLALTLDELRADALGSADRLAEDIVDKLAIPPAPPKTVMH